MSKTKLQIKTTFGSVLWESEKETIREAVVDANLYGANLRDANLRGADLRDANLRDADLRGADLRDANLRGADLRDADLRDADLRGANLRGADLRDANLYDANLYGADLRDADLRDADLRGADLRDADLRDANLRGADLRDANLYDANLYGANLRDADLWQLPEDYIFQCSRDILLIFQQLKTELPEFKKKLIKGEINGSQYTGDCACLVGTIAKVKNESVDKVCNDFIPFYSKGTHNAGESWFLNIKENDTPENNQFSAHVLKLIEMVETGVYHTIKYTPTPEQKKEWEEKFTKTQEEIKKNK